MAAHRQVAVRFMKFHHEIHTKTPDRTAGKTVAEFIEGMTEEERDSFTSENELTEKVLRLLKRYGASRMYDDRTYTTCLEQLENGPKKKEKDVPPQTQMEVPVSTPVEPEPVVDNTELFIEPAVSMETEERKVTTLEDAPHTTQQKVIKFLQNLGKLANKNKRIKV